MSLDPASGASVQPQLRSSLEPVEASQYESVARLSMLDATTGMAFEALTPSSHRLTIDTGVEFGGAATGPEPLELLLVALGSCTAMDVISIMRKKRQQVTHYNVNVYANLAKEYPKTYTYILVEHVISGVNIDVQAVARSLELSITKYCPVHALLSRATRVEQTYRVLGETE